MVHVFSVTSVMSESLRCYGLELARILCPGDSPGKNIAVGRHSLLQEIFQTQGLNLCLLHFRQIYLPLSHRESPKTMVQFNSVQSLSRVQLFVTPWIAARQASMSVTNSRSSLIFMSIESVMSSSHLILCRPLLLLPPIPPSIRVFSNEPTLCMRWPKYWSFSFSIIPSKEHSRLISFRMD